MWLSHSDWRWGVCFAALLLALGTAAMAPARAANDSDYFLRHERESQRRAAEELRFDQMRQGWRERAQERALMRQERVPAVKRAIPPTDRLSSKLYPTLEPLGHLSPRVENAADVHRRTFAPSSQRLVPKSLQEFQRYREQSR